MAIGPVQLLVLGFPQPNFRGEIIAEIDRLKENDTVRVVDSLAVYKHDDGQVEVLQLSNLSQDEAIEVGSKVGALIGLGMKGEEGFVAGAVAGAEAGAAGVALLPEDTAGEIVEELPAGSAAALILLEHQWAVPLRDAVARAGGYRVKERFISPLDLVEIGMASAEEARQLQIM